MSVALKDILYRYFRSFSLHSLGAAVLDLNKTGAKNLNDCRRSTLGNIQLMWSEKYQLTHSFISRGDIKWKMSTIRSNHIHTHSCIPHSDMKWEIPTTRSNHIHTHSCIAYGDVKWEIPTTRYNHVRTHTYESYMVMRSEKHPPKGQIISLCTRVNPTWWWNEVRNTHYKGKSYPYTLLYPTWWREVRNTNEVKSYPYTHVWIPHDIGKWEIPTTGSNRIPTHPCIPHVDVKWEIPITGSNHIPIHSCIPHGDVKWEIPTTKSNHIPTHSCIPHGD